MKSLLTKSDIVGARQAIETEREREREEKRGKGRTIQDVEVRENKNIGGIVVLTAW